MSRRKFLQFGGTAALTVLLPASGLLSGCSADQVTGALDNMGVKSGLDATFRGTASSPTPGVGREPSPQSTSSSASTSRAPLRRSSCSRSPRSCSAARACSTPRRNCATCRGTENLIVWIASGGGEIDREVLLKQDIQLIIDCSGTTLSAADVSTAEKLESQTNIPALCIDGSFDNIRTAYKLLGEILGAEERAGEIATYLERVYNDVTAATADIPDSEKVRLYYAEGPLGLQTEPDRGQHALTFDVAGANNVSAVEETQGIGMTNVSLEAVLAWDPEVIIAWDDVIRGGADEIIRTDEKWSHISAVKNGRVYTMPNAPFAWCDRPPGVNRFLGVQWIANMLYPDRYDVDMVEEVKNFYSLLYWVDITDDDARELLGNSYPPYGKQ